MKTRIENCVGTYVCLKKNEQKNYNILFKNKQNSSYVLIYIKKCT